MKTWQEHEDAHARSEAEFVLRQDYNAALRTIELLREEQRGLRNVADEDRKRAHDLEHEVERLRLVIESSKSKSQLKREAIQRGEELA